MPALPHSAPDHDEVLVARLAADDLPETDPDAARAHVLVSECPACAELLADLRAISTATAALPPPRRTRDFRLTEADAARLRPAGWRGLLARFGSPSFAFTRPLSAGLATLGIAGLLFATLPSGLGGAATSAPEFNAGGTPVTAQDQSGVNPSAAPSAAAAPSAIPQPGAEGPVAASPDGGAGASSPPRSVASPTAGALTDGGAKAGAGGSVAPNPATGTPAAPGGARDLTASGGPSPLVVLSIVLLVAGIALGGLRVLARRMI